jgi:hypothetical protein
VSVRGLSGLIDRVPTREISHVGRTNVLLAGLDVNRRIEGGLVSNSPLDFKQFSLDHTVQVLGYTLCCAVPQFTPLPTCDCPLRVSPSGKSVDLVGDFSNLQCVMHNPSRRHAAHSTIACWTWLAKTSDRTVL